MIRKTGKKLGSMNHFMVAWRKLEPRKERNTVTTLLLLTRKAEIKSFMSATKDKMSILPSMVPTNVCLKIHLTPMDCNLLESRLKSAPTMILSLIIMIIPAQNGMMIIKMNVAFMMTMISHQRLLVVPAGVALKPWVF
jgi:hypothetical protein